MSAARAAAAESQGLRQYQIYKNRETRIEKFNYFNYVMGKVQEQHEHIICLPGGILETICCATGELTHRLIAG